MAKEPTSEVLKKMSETEPTEHTEPTEPTETEPTEPEPTEPTEPEPTETKINWRENYIRTKLYAHRGGNHTVDHTVDQSAYDALVISLLAHKV